MVGLFRGLTDNPNHLILLLFLPDLRFCSSNLLAMVDVEPKPYGKPVYESMVNATVAAS